MEKQKYICIDIGGTAIKYGLADVRATLFAYKEIEALKEKKKG